MASGVFRMVGIFTASRTHTKKVLKEMRMNIHSKPPRNQIGPGQSFFVMSVFAVVLLSPAAWILHHLPEYRQRLRA
ncbi:COX8 domain-containing protein [Scomber japonicus]|uniref:COX8 domain-containing protein n=1 Tax=Scomber japonicus TaxID=13676 RepID=UPI002304DBAD|nr:COX8 domain-containing protein [Scomber japonicus]